MDSLTLAHVLVPTIGGAVIGAVGVAIGILWASRKPGAEPSHITFHRPITGTLVVEVRSDISAAYAEQLHEWLENEERRVYGSGAHVLLVRLP